jgi:hypothetical protein
VVERKEDIETQRQRLEAMMLPELRVS